MPQPTLREYIAPSPVPTASPLWVGLACAFVALSTLLALVSISNLTTQLITLLVCAAYLAPGAVFEYQRAHGWRLPVARRPLSYRVCLNAVIKTIGLAQILLLAFVLYSIFPEYEKNLYAIWLRYFETGSYLTVLLALFYFIASERVTGGKRDIYYYVGRYSIITLMLRVWVRPALRSSVRMWIVKLFFLPIMLGSLHYSVVFLSKNPVTGAFENFYVFFDFGWELILALDVTLAVVGYIASLKLLGTGVVSTDPTWRGWVATLICYTPFSSVLYGSYLTYEEGLRWGNLLAGNHGVYVAYGSLLLILHSLYLVASLNFGIRYSNLSHRGIITDGLFALTKHPAYLFKNVVWWMIALPFITNGTAGSAIANCFLLFCVNAVYWWRGRTEEMHLSRDPDYVRYALSMNDRSILAFMGKLVPPLAYSPPKGYLREEYQFASKRNR